MRQFNPLSPVQFIFSVMGIGLFAIGAQREASSLAMLGLLPIGLAITMRGVHVMRTRRDIQQDLDFGHEVTYSGKAAYLRGFIAVLTGILLMAIGVLPLFNLEDALTNFVTRGPIVVPVIIGLLIVFSLLPQLVESDQMMSKNIISRLIERIFILFFLMISLIFLVFSFLQATDPPAAEAFYREGVQILPDNIQQQVESWNLYEKIPQPLPPPES